MWVTDCVKADGVVEVAQFKNKSCALDLSNFVGEECTLRPNEDERFCLWDV